MQKLITTVTKRIGVDTYVSDVAPLLSQLLLFDTCIIKSMRLKEIEFIAATYGYDAATRLLKSGAIAIFWDSAVPISSFQRSDLPSLQPLEYTLGYANVADSRQYLHGCLQSFHSVPRLSHKQAIKLKRLTVDACVAPAHKLGPVSNSQVRTHLENNSPIVKAFVDYELRREFKEVPRYNVTFHETNNGFRAITDLDKVLAVPINDVHALIERGLAGLRGLEGRLEEMDSFSAISGFSDTEVALFFDRCRFLVTQVNPNQQQKAFDRVVEISGLPALDLATVGTVNIPKILEIRDTDECRQFRAWLSTVSKASDSEIREQVGSLRAKIGSLIGNAPGKAVRFAAAAAISALWPTAGLAIGVLDTFLLEKLFPKSGPACFLNDMYPSIFEQ